MGLSDFLMIWLNTTEVLCPSQLIRSGCTSCLYILLLRVLTLVTWLKWWLLAPSIIKLPFFFFVINMYLRGDTMIMCSCYFSIRIFTYRFEFPLVLPALSCQISLTYNNFSFAVGLVVILYFQQYYEISKWDGC